MASILEMILGGQNPNQSPVDYNMAAGILGSTMGPPRDAMMAPQPNQMPQSQTAQPGALSQQPGILERMGIQTDNFTGRLGNALIAGGSRNPAETLLALQKGDAEAASAKKPKVTPLADGAFSLITYPDGQTKVVRNDEVAKYLDEMQSNKFTQALEKVKLQGQVNTQTGNDKLTFKENVEAAGGPNASIEFNPAVTTTMGTIDKLLGGVKSADTVKTPLGNVESPFLANLADQTWGRVAGTDDYALRRDFDTLVNTDVLALAEKMKGALSDKDVLFLKSIQPKPDDPVDRKVAYLTELRKRAEAGENKRIAAAKAIRGSGGGDSAPRTSGGVVQVTNEQEWANLPAGTMYKDPNGVVRTKK